MQEKVIVKAFISGKLKYESHFEDYDLAFKYANKKVILGCKCLLLRQIDNKEWVKIWLNPSSSL